MFPQKYNFLLINSDRLTTPYDIHNTLQDIIQIADRKYTPTGSVGCPKCQSLFKEVDEARSCEDASIHQHWCTCKSHDYINSNNTVVKSIALFIIKQINNIIKLFPEGGACTTYSLENVHSAGISKSYLNKKNQTVNYFLVIIKTKPIAMFEATVEAHLELDPEADDNNFKLLGDITRVNRYADNSHCIENGVLKNIVTVMILLVW
ncbi:hypothetical protein NQ314_020628 [Rhamnusium bicolor]|uniref:Uncharacterized protein n=1 Tax=Rhamnusium bicolor TaxID=1586634 RepID=A0AAV8WKZ5_9CUCU|nr:hypothetical protein NQ314_020628 [Rhamnusium bicolor]